MLNFVIQVKFGLKYLRNLPLGSSWAGPEGRFCKFRKYCRKPEREIILFLLLFN